MRPKWAAVWALSTRRPLRSKCNCVTYRPFTQSSWNRTRSGRKRRAPFTSQSRLTFSHGPMQTLISSCSVSTYERVLFFQNWAQTAITAYCSMGTRYSKRTSGKKPRSTFIWRQTAGTSRVTTSWRSWAGQCWRMRRVTSPSESIVATLAVAECGSVCSSWKLCERRNEKRSNTHSRPSHHARVYAHVANHSGKWSLSLLFVQVTFTAAQWESQCLQRRTPELRTGQLTSWMLPSAPAQYRAMSHSRRTTTQQLPLSG